MILFVLLHERENVNKTSPLIEMTLPRRGGRGGRGGRGRGGKGEGRGGKCH